MGYFAAEAVRSAIDRKRMDLYNKKHIFLKPYEGKSIPPSASQRVPVR
jgi:hypothetical protein